MTELLRLEKLSKTFPGVVANSNIDLDIRKGEIHALLGENGAGKSTLMNCVYGVYLPTSGKIFWKENEVTIHQARDAIELGIGMVHQHFMLVPPLSVAENVILGLPSRREPFLDLNSVEGDIRECAKRYHLNVDPKAFIWQLPVGIQQRVEILKALYRNAQLLILDEPTAVLTPNEVVELFNVLKTLVAEGLSIIFITHKLEEVMAVCDRVTVLRDGHKVATVDTADTNKQELARMMVGREVFLNIDKPEVEKGDVVLSIQDLIAEDDRGLTAIKDISFEIRHGEIFGIAGVDGNGQTELADAIAGMRSSRQGKITVNGKDATNRSPREILEMNVSYIPPDRQHMGLLMDFTIEENLIGKTFWSKEIANGVFLKEKVIDQFVDKAIHDFDVRTPGSDLKVKLLSGGNQQKVVLARELSRKPDLLIASQPTRGLDIGATEYVHREMLEARKNGAAILLISTELEEVLSLSDRIAVMYEGEIMGIVSAKDADIQLIGEMMAGVRRIDSGTPSTPETEQVK
ncbi:MAG: ABC transporter ATP-binding protein [Chloroflexi bacterium]|nr:ABC transporter ATP-binding protein [Anaerolineaceae bacterium]NMB87386.1 ABC transporter ATP-binding protein [Chloroflexota bacterium]